MGRVTEPVDRRTRRRLLATIPGAIFIPGCSGLASDQSTDQPSHSDTPEPSPDLTVTDVVISRDVVRRKITVAITVEGKNVGGEGIATVKLTVGDLEESDRKLVPTGGNTKFRFRVSPPVGKHVVKVNGDRVGTILVVPFDPDRFEHYPDIGKKLVGMPWLDDGIESHELTAMRRVFEIADSDHESTAMTLLEADWIQDGVTPSEAWMIHQVKFLRQVISGALNSFRQNKEGNPDNAEFYDEKIALFEQDGLHQTIIFDKRFVAIPHSGVDTAIVACYVSPAMTSGCRESVELVKSALPELISFIDHPYPTKALHIWYGFNIGGSGGPGTIRIEDMSSWRERDPPMPYKAGIFHELAHGYFNAEMLAQFLETYQYNVLATDNTDPTGWRYRSVKLQERDELLELYSLLGHDNASAAFADLYELKRAGEWSDSYPRPPGGENDQVFVETMIKHAPAGEEAKVRKLAASVWPEK